jgi:hypothetical protein
MYICVRPNSSKQKYLSSHQVINLHDDNKTTNRVRDLCADKKKKEKHETRKQRSNRRVPVALNHIHIISSLFFFFFFSKCHIRIYLHVNPPRHPKLRNLLRLVHKPHVQEQLRGASDSTLQRAEDPRVRVGGVFAHCRFRKRSAMQDSKSRFC